ncbi:MULTISPECIES: hypothetical protein [Methylomicrobium]|uniref:Uncharacterized protein n=1 Tax=Methylomicrobium album BG8 TaxID=686340 RepID=H8GPR1_METAL|nr:MULTISPECIES: hypothetical protein [Methylomicrobium]EIC28523.1 hypothetical protein Metal_0684 [Methylomicrobium album BG8]
MADRNYHHRKEDNGTLTARIEETERRLLDRQLSTHVHTGALIKDLRHELASPTTLLLVSELGFIVGELTKKRPSKPEYAAADKAIEGALRAEATPLKEALDFGSLLIALFHALPPAWIMETFHPAEEEAKPKTEPAAVAGKPEAGVELSNPR